MCAEFIVAVEGMVSLSRCSSSLVICYWVCTSNFKKSDQKMGQAYNELFPPTIFPPLSLLLFGRTSIQFRFINAMGSCPEYLGEYFDVSTRISSESAS